MRNGSRLAQFVRGGDVERHQINLLLTNVGAVVAPSAITGGLGYVAAAWALAGKAWPLYWTYNAARVADTVGLGYSSLLSIRGRLPAQFVAEFAGIYHQTFWFTSFVATAAAAAAAYFTGKAVLKRFFKRAETFKDAHLRGVNMQTKEELIAKVEEAWAAAKAKAESSGGKLPNKYSFAGVPLPPGMAQRNILATGGMGSGKSVAIFDLADQVAAAGKTMIVYDKVTEFATYYYRDGKDVIFNPFDSRFPGWNIFTEISQVYEFDQIASYLIPTTDKDGGTSEYFKSAARTIFSCILQKLWEEGRRTNEALCKAIFETGQEDLYNWLKGTAAESLLNPESKGTGGGGVLTTLTEAVKVLRYVPSGNFSLKEFIRQAGDRRIFITSKEEVHEILKPLTAMAMNLLYTSVMAGEQVREDKFWFFLDEFKSMGKLPVLANAVTEARKYGAVTVIGAQNVAQFEEMFGKESAKTIRSNLQNQLILRVADEETQESYSKLIGSGEYDEQSESMSWGVASNKDSESVSRARKERRAVLASEIKLLPDCAGFLQLAGNFDIARVDYKPRGRAVIATGWLPRPDLALESVALKPEQESAGAAGTAHQVAAAEADAPREPEAPPPTAPQAAEQTADGSSEPAPAAPKPRKRLL